MTRYLPILLLLAGCSFPGIDKRSPDSLASEQAYKALPRGTNAAPAVTAVPTIPLPEAGPAKAVSMAVLPPPTNKPVILPNFPYPKGAETNWWDLQRMCSQVQGWVTIGTFYGTNGAGTFTPRGWVPWSDFRVIKHVGPVTSL